MIVVLFAVFVLLMATGGMVIIWILCGLLIIAFGWFCIMVIAPIYFWITSKFISRSNFEKSNTVKSLLTAETGVLNAIDKTPTVMNKEELISDNPFRLLGVGSSTPLQILRRKAEAVSRSAAVGLTVSIPLEAEFGAGGLSELAQSARSLANDPTMRTAYRIMWPLNDAAIPFILNGDSISSKTNFPADEIIQLNFLNAWYNFLGLQSSENASVAFQHWSNLFRNYEFQHRLEVLLQEEDNLPIDVAHTRSLEAQELVLQYLFRSVVNFSINQWNEGKYQSAVKILDVINSCKITGILKSREVLIHEAMEPVIEIGQRLSDEIQQHYTNVSDFTSGNTVSPPKELEQLEQLHKCLYSEPIVKAWNEVIEEWYLAIGWKMRNAAIDLNNDEDDTEGALQLIKDALKLARDSELKNKLLADQEDLKKILSDKKTRSYSRVFVLPKMLHTWDQSMVSDFVCMGIHLFQRIVIYFTQSIMSHYYSSQLFP